MSNNYVLVILSSIILLFIELFNNFSLFVSFVIFLIKVNIYGPQWKLLNFSVIVLSNKVSQSNLKKEGIIDNV